MKVMIVDVTKLMDSRYILEIEPLILIVGMYSW